MAADKKLVMAILAKRPTGPAPADKAEDKPEDGLTTAAQELIDAVKSGDTQGVAEALKAAIQMCGHYGDEDETETDGE